MNKQLKTEEWFAALLEDCDAIITETVHNARWDTIRGYHDLGKRILQENHNFERSKVYGEDIVQCIAKSIGKSKRTIYYAIRFAEQYEDINSLPEGKNISWYKVCTKVLPAATQNLGTDCGHDEIEEVMIKRCKCCNKKIDK